MYCLPFNYTKKQSQ